VMEGGEKEMLYCTYCGWQGLAQFFVWDHAIPLSRGGADAPHNRVVACVGCNFQKGAKTQLEYCIWRQLNPRKANFGPY
jgi:5-methylcytosine-specific restriction endonuclease McrA